MTDPNYSDKNILAHIVKYTKVKRHRSIFVCTADALNLAETFSLKRGTAVLEIVPPSIHKSI